MNPIPPRALLEPIAPENDWVQGGVTGIDYTERTNGDWSGSLPTREPQRFKFDTNECSTISATKNIEMQLNFLKPSMSPEALQWFTNNGYIDSNGSFNLSERFSGIMAGTSMNGNSQNTVWESIRNVGFLPNSDLNYSLAESQKFLTQYDMCQDYYNPHVVTKVMETKAKLVFRYITLQYEWVWANKNKSCPVDLIAKALKQSPLQIGTPVCPDWNSGNVHSCGDTSVAHATNIYQENSDGSFCDFDHYNPYLKTLSSDYFIPYVLKPVITLNPVPQASQPYVTYSVLAEFIALLRKIGVIVGGIMTKAWKSNNS